VSGARIVVDHVRKSFENGRVRALEDVSFLVEPGELVSLTGSSGSGKSTLLNLLAGLYKPVTGDIAYDGRALHDMDVRAVRQQIGIVPQHPYIFGGTLRENVALTAPGATLDRIMAACKVSSLHDDISEMPMSYDTVVSDGGGSLSGGQRQRVAIARAVIRNPSLMLLDEATSALDNATEAKVTENLERQRCTRITVAHRLTTVRNADLIVVMDKGRIVEQGNHKQLLAHGGLYAKLVAASQNNPEQPYDQIPLDRGGSRAGSSLRSARNSASRA
jgi:ATP-binding cassette subfamily B protein